MRPKEAILFAMSGDWKRVLRIQDPVDLGCRCCQSRQASRPVATNRQVTTSEHRERSDGIEVANNKATHELYRIR